jgi:MurNAc alpha-1-phosphate uridylyltransferase
MNLKKTNITVALLAGGLATRLRPLTEKIPKALIDVAGIPFIHHQLNYLKNQNLQSVVICSGYLGHMIEEEVGSGKKFGLDIRYSHDGPKLLGTGGALKSALPLLGSQFFILYGDSFLPIEFSPIYETFKNSHQLALMTVYKNQNEFDASNALYENGKVMAYQKKSPPSHFNYIDYGLGIMTASVLGNYPHQHFDLATIYENLALKNKLAGYEVFERFYEIGTPQGLQDTIDYLK